MSMVHPLSQDLHLPPSNLSRAKCVSMSTSIHVLLPIRCSSEFGIHQGPPDRQSYSPPKRFIFMSQLRRRRKVLLLMALFRHDLVARPCLELRRPSSPVFHSLGRLLDRMLRCLVQSNSKEVRSMNLNSHIVHPLRDTSHPMLTVI